MSDRQLWAWLAGEAASERLAGIPLSRIERLGERDLLDLRGVGPRGARAIRAVAELGRRVAGQPPQPGAAFEGCEDVERHYRRRLAHEERELCYVLDTRLRLLREALLSIGGLNGVGVEPRDVFAPVVRERAASAIVLHNHPSGVPEASAQDLGLAVRLWRAAGILGVKLLDFVVARDGFTSPADLGLLADGDDTTGTRIVHRGYARTRQSGRAR